MKKLLLFGGLILLAVSAVLLRGSLIQLIMPPIYQSVARVLVQEASVNIGSLVNHEGSHPDLATQQLIERLQAKVLLGQVITNLDLNQKWGAKFKLGTFPIETTYAMLNSQLEIELAPRNTNIIEIRVRSEDAAEAAAIANEIAKVRLEQLSAVDREMTASGIKVLDTRAQAMAVEILGLEAKLKQMGEQLNLAVDAPQPALLDKGDSGGAMLKLRRELQALQANRERLMSRLQEEKVKSLIPGHGPVQLIDSAEAGLRPVKPSQLAKILMPVGGLLSGVVGVILLLLGFKFKAPVRKLPPPLPV